MLDKIGFEVLPNVYFRNIQITKVATTRDNLDKGIFKRLKFKVKLFCYDDITTKTWSKNDSMIKPLMQIKLNFLMGEFIEKEYVIPISANKEIEYEIEISENLMNKYYNIFKEGDILFFPSYMLHRAPVNNTNKRKTVIAFNCDFQLIPTEYLGRHK